MNKMQMAHEYALEMLKEAIPTGSLYGSEAGSVAESIVKSAFALADMMQAEADKREDKTRPKALLTKDKDGKCLHFNHEFGHKKCMDCGASLEEWQPDWSQAPDNATAWEYLGHESARWHTTTKGMFRSADLFGYSGIHMFLVERPQ